jgi:glycosyltransferase involved in cell wall biosynthesis
VIVTDAEPRRVSAIRHHLATLGRTDVRLVVAEGNDLTLGRLRNLSLEASRGELVCQWDDDDLYHPERLGTQVAALKAKDATACFLTDQLHYFTDERQLYWIDWSGGGRVPGKWALVPGTVLRRRDGWRYPEDGPAARRGEDSALVDALAPASIVPLGGSGHLYVYRYHGDNTFPLDHHRGQLDRAASIDFIRRHAGALQRALDYYPLPRPVSVLGRRGDVGHMGR